MMFNNLLFLHNGESGAPASVPAATPPASGGETGGSPAPAASGSAEGATNSTATETPAVDKSTAFQALIKGEYAEQYQQAVEGVLKRRLAPMTRLKEQAASQQALINAIGLRYGMDGSNLEALQKAVDEDRSYIERIADEKGMTMDQAAGWLKDQQKIAEFESKMREVQVRQQVEQNRQQFAQAIQEIKSVYPDFDPETELNDPRFVQALSILSPLGAYEALHREEINSNLIRMAAQETEKRVTDNIRANGMRPAENGLSSSGMVPNTVDLDKMSLKELNALIKRGQAGEKIRFGRR